MVVKGTKREGHQCEKSLACVSKENRVIGQTWTKLMGKDQGRKGERGHRKRESYKRGYCRKGKHISFIGIDRPCS